jgi:hypothetical protein
MIKESWRKESKRKEYWKDWKLIESEKKVRLLFGCLVEVKVNGKWEELRTVEKYCTSR